MLLSYRVVACTSEDESHPARELQRYSADSRGWQSTRWCDFPQELVLQFQGGVTLQQVQVLSHQFKIASRVELFMGSLPPGVSPPSSGCEGVTFSRLGHFSLDSNERSKFQARELKTVYVPQATAGLYLRLVLHKCHLGVLAVRAIGSGPGAMSLQQAEQRESVNALSSAPAYPPLNGAGQPPLQMDARVAAEDYDQAKLLKDQISSLQRAGVQIAELERRKQEAVGREDYDLAKRLKEQLVSLRELAGVPAPPPRAQPPSLAPPKAGATAGGLGEVGGGELELLRRQEQAHLQQSREEAQARIDRMATQPMAGKQPPPRAKTQQAHDERPVAALAQQPPELPSPKAEGGEPSLPEAAPLSAADSKDAAIIIEATPPT
ncbi:MAG: hypothetical protein SGPRY_011936 [Prymnesium sp.]